MTKYFVVCPKCGAKIPDTDRSKLLLTELPTLEKCPDCGNYFPYRTAKTVKEE